MARSRHPNKDIEAAVQYAENQGWRCIAAGHWGRLLFAPFCAQYAHARERPAHEICGEVKEICWFFAPYARAREEQAERWAEGLDYIRWPSAWRAGGACTLPSRRYN
jgi:hypothetical protein